MKRTFLFIIFVLIFSFVSGCKGSETGDGTVQNNENDEIVFSLCNDAGVISMTDSYSLKNFEDMLGGECSFSQFSYEDDLYGVLEYAHDGAQYAYKYEIYKLDDPKPVFLYSPNDIKWINEFTAYMDKLFWIEFTNDSDCTHYRIMMFDPELLIAECLAEYRSTEVYEMSLCVGGGIMAWFVDSNEKTTLCYYDIESNEICNVDDEKITLCSPYSRMFITDNMVSFTVENESGDLCCERYKFRTGEKEVDPIETAEQSERIAGCISDIDFCIWYTDSGKKKYYCRDLKSGKISNIVYSDKENIFSFSPYSGHIYMNVRGETDCLYDVQGGSKISRYEYPDNMTAYWFNQNKNGLYLKLESPETIGVTEFK